jgi:OmpA-OmpF porin, OOP family
MFHSNTSKLTGDHIAVLERAWGKLWQMPRWGKIVINGFSDGMGSDAANEHMSMRRAAAVAEWFINAKKVNPKDLVVQGWGKESPRGSNATKQGREQNRRVEIVIRNY